MTQTKKCGCCGEYKKYIEFWGDKSTQSGLKCYCKSCARIKRREYEVKNYNKNKTKYYGKNKDYHGKNRATILLRKKIYRESNKEKIAKQAHDRYMKNRKVIDKNSTEYHEKQKSYALGLKLHRAMRGAIALALKGKKKRQSWEKLAGYNLSQLRVHLKKQFQLGMTWENYGKGGWHIDHKIPVSAFNFEKPEDIDFKRCWALSNLQPLWAMDNFRKSAKLEKPFQPSFRF